MRLRFSLGSRLRQLQQGQEHDAADQPDQGEDRRRIQRQQQPARQRRTDDVTATARHLEPADVLGDAPATRKLGDVCQRHRSVNGRRQAMRQPNNEQLLRRLDEAIEKGHEGEETGADQQPDPPPPAIGQNAEERLKEEPGHGGYRDD